MIQTYKAGELTFIDWAGLTVPIYNSKDGAIEFEAQIFVSTLGASSYIFCKAVRSQQIPDVSLAHKSMNEFYNGVTDYWVPDNFKGAVTKSHRYEPSFQANYEAMAIHYNIAILPARVRKPQDKWPYSPLEENFRSRNFEQVRTSKKD